MNLENVIALIEIFNNTQLYMLIVVRIIGFLVFTPVVGGSTVPAMVRVGFAMVIATIVLTSVDVTVVVYSENILSYGLIILKEFLIGLIIGFVTYLLFNAVFLAGQLSDQQMGFSMANVLDPLSNTQVPITGNIYYMALSAIFIANRGHHMMITALFYSYEMLPIGGANIVGNGSLTNIMIEIMSKFFSLGLLIAMPIIGVVLTMEVALGVLVRAVPKVNVFSLGMPLKSLAGLFALWIVAPSFLQVYSELYTLAAETILKIIRVMI
ncbi:MAG: flagellar biosynthetic protein FliR [bacterium]